MLHNPPLAYGATLLSAAMTEAFLLYLQLGDGDIIVVSETSNLERAVPKNETILGNETTSLCHNEAWRYIRTTFQAIADRLPALIMLSTDGYANSFVKENGYLRVGAGFLELRDDFWVAGEYQHLVGINQFGETFGGRAGPARIAVNQCIVHNHR